MAPNNVTFEMNGKDTNEKITQTNSDIKIMENKEEKIKGEIGT